MRTIKGPALLIAQLASDRPPFNTLAGIAKWAARLGYFGLQLPSSDTRFLDLHRCAASQTYADEITGVLKEHGLAVTELVTALQGSGSQSILPMTHSTTHSRRRACEETRKRVRPGRSRR